MRAAVIQTRKLTKKNRVHELDLEVREGEIYGFLGPNGAGKTTTLKMLLGLVKPSAGAIRIFGESLGEKRSAILRQTGSLIESPSYYGHLTGLENLRVVQRLRGLPDRNVEEALRIVRLEKHRDKKAEAYSLGMKQRLGIAMALLAFPRLLILDEPTNGLDPAGMEEIRELIKTLPGRYGMTVLLSSHLLAEIEQIATSVGIINEGRMVFQGSLDSLRPEAGAKSGSIPGIMPWRNGCLPLTAIARSQAAAGSCSARSRTGKWRRSTGCWWPGTFRSPGSRSAGAVWRIFSWS